MDNNDSWDDYEKKLSSLYGQQRSEKEEEIEEKIKIVFTNIDK
ncbi:MAG: hypothetical protein BWY34_00270 [Parcubacteria group bacterium ADurb.Bin247]|jgi:hypothetical protein|nr:MAG: hypothetical protein BWY34_00270 [Parcubacteria group bacterium ADurb.Bin247]HQB85048.1 hypothetical protein [Candidatus Pacearchaeota archaeon]